MIPEYCERFGLDSDPFANNTFYITPDLELLADQITHASQFSAGFVVVCGKAGIGKTAFAKFFYSQLIATQESILLDVAVASSAQALLLQLADFLALPVSSESTMGELLAQLRTMTNGGNEALAVTVVLDDAHLLADDTLAALVSLLQVPAGYHRPFSFVLFSELELAPRLDQFQMPDVAVQDIAFPVMTASDVTAMLNYRMELAGFLGQPLFGLRQVEQFWEEADGRLDNSLELARLDLQGRTTEADAPVSPAKKGALPVVHIAAVAGLLAALGLVYLYQGDGDAEQSPDGVIKQLPAPSAKVVSRTESTTTAPPISVAGPVESGDDQKAVVAAPLPSSAVAEVSLVNEGSAVVSAPPLAVSESATTQDVSNVKSLGAPSTGASSSAASSVASQVLRSAAKAEPEVQWANDEGEILSWPSSDYSLQVLGVSSRDAAKAYVQRQANSDYLRIMATQRSNKPWFIVLAGRYDSFALAKRAATDLPAEQVKAGPWPRKVKELQVELTQ